MLRSMPQDFCEMAWSWSFLGFAGAGNFAFNDVLGHDLTPPVIARIVGEGEGWVKSARIC